VQGIILRAQWDKIEPIEGQYDFSYYDRGFELAKKYNKRIEIRVSAGKHSPEWVYAAGAEKFTFHHRNDKPAEYMPIPWHPVFQEKYGNLIKKLGERYNSSPYLSDVVMSGFGHEVESWFCTTKEDMPAYRAIGGNPKWLEGAKWVAALYNRSFPNTPFLIAMAPPSRDDEGRATLKRFVDDGVKDYPHRFGFMACSLKPNDKPDSLKLSYQSVNRFSDQTVTGFEMLLATYKLKGTLKQALDTAIALKAQFVEVYEPDLIDPKQQEVLAEATVKLKKNLTWNKEISEKL
jgi:Beta-galactosidase